MPKHLGCDLASTRHVEASGTGQPIDTVQAQAGHTVLLMGQNVRAYGGLYVVGEGQWQRHPDFSSAAQMEAGTTFFVRGGVEHKHTEWFLEEPVGVVESDGLYFKRRSYATAVRAGGGLELDESNAVVGIEEKYGVQGDYTNPKVSLDARGLATYAESGGFSEGLLEGLEVTRLSATSVEISEGAAWIPGGNAGAGELLAVDFPITKSGLVLPPNSVVHLYLWSNGGAEDVEFSTQRSASPYHGGRAAVKGGPSNTDFDTAPDDTRRYLFTVLTDGSGGIRRFWQEGETVFYDEETAASPFRLLNDGRAAAPTHVSALGAVPPNSRVILARFDNFSTSQTVHLGNPDVPAPHRVSRLSPTGDAWTRWKLSADGRMTYEYPASPSAGFGLVVDVLGYEMRR